MIFDDFRFEAISLFLKGRFNPNLSGISTEVRLTCTDQLIYLEVISIERTSGQNGKITTTNNITAMKGKMLKIGKSPFRSM